MNLKDTLFLGDAVRIAGPQAFNIMLKPAGSLCNLDCHYCYYLDKAEIYGGHEPRMSEEMLEKTVREYIEPLHPVLRVEEREGALRARG